MLRWMNMIYELGMEGKNMLVFIPVNLPVAGPASPIGMMGIRELIGSAQGTPQESQGASQERKQ
jgi:hypothetical protein